jgi:DNA polymerase-3 subunit epsilon
MNLDYNSPWTEFTFIALDTETSGAYPIGSEIVEFSMIKWRNGEEIGELQSLIKPSIPMGETVIKIHGITNEMVKDSPPLSDKIKEIYDFISDGIVVAHHAPFDLGFLAYDFEKHNLQLPRKPALCSSLLSRNLITGSPNHKLQTLIKYLNLPQGMAHRASDDARACLQVTLLCLNKLGKQASLKEILHKQGKRVYWEDYSIKDLNLNPTLRQVSEATINKRELDFVYESKNKKISTRRAKPIGIVRNPDGDFMQALCYIDKTEKRFYLNKIKEAQVVLY